MESKFEGNFTQQDAIPEIAIERANEVLRSGRLHRYNLAENEIGEVGLLETEFAKFVGSNYCLAVASGGYTLSTALRALGIGYGDKVLTNAFTLAPVPGAIASVGAIPVFVDVTEKLVIDLDDLSVIWMNYSVFALKIKYLLLRIAPIQWEQSGGIGGQVQMELLVATPLKHINTLILVKVAF